MQLKQLILPPDINVIAFILGLLLLKKHIKFAKGIIVLSLASLLLLSLPPVTRLLLLSIETVPPISQLPVKNSNTMIVVLGGSIYKHAPEYGGAHIYRRSLERLHYAAKLHRQTDFPILATGGSPLEQDHSEAEIMQRALKEHYAITDVLVETQSRTTYENAFYTIPILKINDIDKIILVTSALHMQRAISVFENQGIEILPAPTVFYSAIYQQHHPWYDIMPSANSLLLSRQVLHEWLGMIWYKLRGYN